MEPHSTGTYEDVDIHSADTAPLLVLRSSASAPTSTHPLAAAARLSSTAASTVEKLPPTKTHLAAASSPLLRCMDPRRVLLAAAVAAAMVLYTLSSMKTEFSLVQQVTCQLALWPDDHLVVHEPLRLVKNASFHEQQLRSARTAGSCQPGTFDAATIAYPAAHTFYSNLRDAQLAGSFPPPDLQGVHTELCDETRGRRQGWDYCLPITGRKDEPHCSHTDRADLLGPIEDKPCFGSALHMILVDVYEQLQAHGGRPLVLFGTLLGAVRSGTTIPFTEDADVGYVCHQRFSLATLRDALWTQGYHMFYQGIWRVCIAPTHPLAPVLYDANMTTTKKHKVPYVDLYSMNPEGEDHALWRVDKMEKNRRIPRDKFEPSSQVTLNNMTFDTVADPVDFLLNEYGDDYLTPKPRD